MTSSLFYQLTLLEIANICYVYTLAPAISSPHLKETNNLSTKIQSIILVAYQHLHIHVYIKVRLPA